MITIGKRLLTAALAGLILAGCASTKTPEQVHLDGALSGLITVEELHVRRGDSGLLEVQMTGRNRLDRVILMTYQFDWLDEDGRQVPSLMSRKTRATADRLRYFTISGVAPSEEVTDFRLYIDERAR